jgi:hypothetical protein
VRRRIRGDGHQRSSAADRAYERLHQRRGDPRDHDVDDLDHVHDIDRRDVDRRRRGHLYRFLRGHFDRRLWHRRYEYGLKRHRDDWRRRHRRRRYGDDSLGRRDVDQRRRGARVGVLPAEPWRLLSGATAPRCRA